MDVAELAPRGDVDQPLDDVRLEPAASEVEVDATECQPWLVADVQLRRATSGGQELAEGHQTVATSSVASGSHGDRAVGDVDVVGLLGELIDDRHGGRRGVAVGPDRVEDAPPRSSPEVGNRRPRLGNCRGRSDEPGALMALCAGIQHDVSGMWRDGHPRCVARRHHRAVASVTGGVGLNSARWIGGSARLDVDLDGGVIRQDHPRSLGSVVGVARRETRLQATDSPRRGRPHAAAGRLDHEMACEAFDHAHTAGRDGLELHRAPQRKPRSGGELDRRSGRRREFEVERAEPCTVRVGTGPPAIRRTKDERCHREVHAVSPAMTVWRRLPA